MSTRVVINTLIRTNVRRIIIHYLHQFTKKKNLKKKLLWKKYFVEAYTKVVNEVDQIIHAHVILY